MNPSNDAVMHSEPSSPTPMKAITKPAFLTAFLLLLPNFAHPASIGAIGASLLGDSPGGTATWLLARADLAGVVPQTNWNNIDCNVTNIPPYVGISGPLIDYAGNMSAVQLQFVANDAWNGNGSAATPNDKLMKGVLKQTAGSSITLIFTNVPVDSYEVYVYGDVDTGPQSLDVSIGGMTSYWLEPDAYHEASGFIASTNFTDPNTPGPGNYVKFTGVTPAGDGTITITVTPHGDDLGIAGLQIISSTGFPITIVRQPQPTTAVVGWPAGFAVQYSGSFASFQWFSNNVAIPGATNASYKTLPVTVGYNGAQYKVIVTNKLNSVTSDGATLSVVTD